ncbi:MAG TPA: hypothetical protein VMF89_13660, partial [Polyangiales bacterium]|nr:hypothetical protein [Polyangiales bacterium]
GRTPNFACYDVETRSIVYRAGKVVGPFASPELLDFTQMDERRNWSERSDAYGAKQTDGDGNSNHLSLRVTANHKMYVQLGTETSGSKIAWREQARKRVAPIQVEAAALIPASAGLPPKRYPNCPDYTHVGFLAAAHEGFGEPANVCEFLRVELGLPNDEAALSFIEFYGVWLGDGTLAVDSRNVQVTQRKQTDVEFLNAVLPACGLAVDEWHVNTIREREGCELKACSMPAGTEEDDEEGERTLELRIKNLRWWTFFWKEYEPKYGDHSKAQVKSAKVSVPGRMCTATHDDRVLTE